MSYKIRSMRRIGMLILSLGLTFAFFCCSGNVRLDWTIDDLSDRDITVHTALQTQYLNGHYLSVPQEANGKTVLDRPAPVHIEWLAQSDGGGADIGKYRLELSLNPKFSDPIVYETNQPQYDVYNLLLGATYYYRVTALMKNGRKSVSPVRSFDVPESAPRNLQIEGVRNVRDLGGWKTSSGKTVKQGKLIRCGRLNKSEQPEVEIEITQSGIFQFKEVFGVRSEVDLRMPDAHNTENGGIVSSPLGEGVIYRNIPMEWSRGNDNYLEDQIFRAAILSFFEFIADENNYPIIFHCSIGTDRTGFFAFLVNGLLGVRQEDLYRDYLFSNFSNIGSRRTAGNISSYVNTIQTYQGSTLSERIENCLISIGVSKKHLDSVRKIMLG